RDRITRLCDRTERPSLSREPVGEQGGGPGRGVAAPACLLAWRSSVSAPSEPPPEFMGQKLRDRVLESVFSVRPAELRLTALLFAQCLCTVGAFIIGRSVRDALFMAHRSSEELAAMYIASALTVTGAGLV